MGKHGKKLKQHQQDRGRRHCTNTANLEDDGSADALPSSAYSPELSEHGGGGVDDESNGGDDESSFSSLSLDSSSKFSLYQKSVQSPKGDISYLQKFFLMHVGGRMPLHLREDFCGTALLRLVCYAPFYICNCQNFELFLHIGASMINHGEVCLEPVDILGEIISGKELDHNGNVDCEGVKKIVSLPSRDIICAFNYCCMQNHADLVIYFKNSIKFLSSNGGIFVMDLYGGTSSECELRLKRRFPNFTCVWEQEEFDVINRTTRISLHFHLDKSKCFVMHLHIGGDCGHYQRSKIVCWKLGSSLFMSGLGKCRDTDNTVRSSDFNASRDVKYEEVNSFRQEDAWNAYIVAVIN